MTKHANILKLRPYQIGKRDEVIRRLNCSLAALLVGCTGCGKTEIIMAFIERLHKGARVLVLVERLDLVREIAQRFADHFGDRRTITTRANSLPSEFHLEGDATTADIVIGTVQTITSLLSELGEFDVLVIDEAHHSICSLYRTILADLRARKPSLRLFGTTAVPERADRYGLDVLFGGSPIVITLHEMLTDGWLVPPRVLSLPLETIKQAKLDQLGLTDGDDEDASAIFNLEVVHDEVIRNYVLHAEGRKAIYFACNVNHTNGLAERFSRTTKFDVEAVSHKTPVGKRTRMLKAFCDGKGPDILINPFLLTEGFNPPLVSCIGIVRTFRHKSTMINACGRGLRLYHGKQDCLILDHTGATRRHGDLVAGLDLRTLRGLGREGGGGGGRKGDPTVLGYNVGELEPYDILKMPDVTFLAPREVEIRKPEPRMIDGKPIVTREEAVARGLNKYFTGKPCKHGHVAERVLRGGCLPCGNERPGDPERRAKRNEQQRKRREDPDYRENYNEQHSEWRRCQREADPEYHAKERERDRKRTTEPTWRAKRNEQQRKRREDPEIHALDLEKRRERTAKRRAERDKELSGRVCARCCISIPLEKLPHVKFCSPDCRDAATTERRLARKAKQQDGEKGEPL